MSGDNKYEVPALCPLLSNRPTHYQWGLHQKRIV